MSNTTATRNPRRVRDNGHKQRQPRPAPRRMTTRQAVVLAELAELEA